MNFRFAARLTTLTATLALGLPFHSFAQDLEDDVSVPASESSAPATPSADLNEAVDQLSRESRGSNTPPAPSRMREPTPAPSSPAAVSHPARVAAPARPPKAFAQKSKVKPPKRKAVKVARRAASTGKAKKAKPAAKKPRARH